MTTIKLTKPVLLGTRHYPADEKITVSDGTAERLVKEKSAVKLNNVDMSVREQPPAKRVMLETASVDHAPSKAARVSGRAQ